MSRYMMNKFIRAVEMSTAAREAGVPFSADSEGGMFGFFFGPKLPQNYPAVLATDKERFNRFFHGMLERGVYLAPALYEAGFVSAAHSRHCRDRAGSAQRPASSVTLLDPGTARPARATA